MENNVKQTIGINISELRKSYKMTQADLASKLHYSDKAVSRWEKGSTLPDIDVLLKICDIFGVSFDYLIRDNSDKEKYTKIEKADRGNRITIVLLAITLVWFLATIIYVYTGIMGHKWWQGFLWAVPVMALVCEIFNRQWGIKFYSLFTLTLLNWGLITATYLQLLSYNIWLLFILGAPIQVCIFLWYNIKSTKKYTPRYK